jgi:hypothetical protein
MTTPEGMGKPKVATPFRATYASPELYQASGGEDLQTYISEVTQRTLTLLAQRAEAEGKIIDWGSLATEITQEQNNWVLKAEVDAYQGRDYLNKQRENTARREVSRGVWQAES